MAPVRWTDGPFRITSLGGRNATYYLFCGPKYLETAYDMEALRARVSALDPRKILAERPTPAVAPPRMEQTIRERRNTTPRLRGTFTMMLDGETPDNSAPAATQEEEAVATTTKKKAAPRKKTAAKKPASAPKPKKAPAPKKAAANGTRTRVAADTTFKVDLAKSDRRPNSVGFKHLQNMKNNEDKTIGELRKRDWFVNSRLARDQECGALTLYPPKD